MTGGKWWTERQNLRFNEIRTLLFNYNIKFILSNKRLNRTSHNYYYGLVIYYTGTKDYKNE